MVSINQFYSIISKNTINSLVGQRAQENAQL